MKKLLIATHNKAKLGELMLGTKELIQNNWKVYSLNDLKITEDTAETGSTFEENARIKALFYGDKSGIPTVADDGGLLIKVLNGEPGVKSKRWLDREASDSELIKYALKRLSGVTKNKRTAYLQTSICYYNPRSKRVFCETRRIKGLIANRQSGNPTRGYPYRALFIVDRFRKYYDELTEDEHLLINHRLIALKELIKKIKRDLIQ